MPCTGCSHSRSRDVQSFRDHTGRAAGQPQQLTEKLHAIPITKEIVVNDDAQGEGSAAWIPRLRGPNDFYISSPNLHEPRAYNRLASMMRGEFLVLVQGDACLPNSSRCWAVLLLCPNDPPVPPSTRHAHAAFHEAYGTPGHMHRHSHDGVRYAATTLDSQAIGLPFHSWMQDALAILRTLPKLAMLSGRMGFYEVLTRAAPGTNVNQDYRRQRMRGEMPSLPIKHQLLVRRNDSATSIGASQISTEGDGGRRIPFMFMAGVDNGPLIFRRDALLSLGGFDEGYGCAGDVAMHYDFEMALRFWMHGYQVGVFYGSGTNGVGSRKSLRKETRSVRHRSEIQNAAKVQRIWSEHGASIQRTIEDANAKLTEMNDSQAEMMRVQADQKHGKVSRDKCAPVDATYTQILSGGARQFTMKCSNMTSISDWTACLDSWEPAHSCLVLGIGGGENVDDASSFGFERQLASSFRCEVHAIDSSSYWHKLVHSSPEVRERAESVIKVSPTLDSDLRVQFHEAFASRLSATSTRTGAPLLITHLPRIIELYAGKRDIDILKIDCRGCEWSLFNKLIRRRKTLQPRVKLLLLRIDLCRLPTEKGASSVAVLAFQAVMSYLVIDNSFKLFSWKHLPSIRHPTTTRGKVPHGSSASSIEVPPELVMAGLPRDVCRYQLQFTR